MRNTCNRKSAEKPKKWKILTSSIAAFVIFLIKAEISWAGLACLSNPCLYGICIDDINGTYGCYCIDGYTGIQCQTNWDECWSSPCHNGGTCVDGIAEFNCTCPQGFQGDLCEQNIDECKSDPCNNNGTCIDGPNGYSCACQAGYTGDFCELDISVCNDTDETRCENGGLCIEGPGINFQCVCPLGWEGKLCEKAVDECRSSPCQNQGVCLDLHANYTCACQFGFTGRNCEIQLMLCGESSPCENDAFCLIEDWLSVCYCVPDYHGDRCQFKYDECLLGPGCKNGGTCIDGIDSFTCSCPPDLTGDYCECLIVSENDTDCNYVRPTTTTLYPPSSTEEQTVPIWIETEVPKSSQHDYSSTSSTEPETTSSLITTSITTTTTTTTTTTATTLIPETTEITTIEATTQEKFTAKETARLPTTEYDTTTECFSEEGKEETTTTEIATTVRETETETTPGFIEITTSDFYPSTQLPVNCKKTPCLNGGMCLNTTSGQRCVCRPDWEGPLCDEKVGIKIAAFSGRSYLSHHLTNTSKASIDITARTVAPVGTILYAHLGPDVYMSLYLEDGLLKFKFSCGFQTMLLSEVQFHINNGYDLVATVILEFLPRGKNSRHCAATVRVNNTLAMSGEQMARDPHTDLSYAWVNIGGVPGRFADNGEAPVLEGFIGCMQNLVIDGKPKNLIKDAFETNDVKECMSLACLSNPCYSGSTCIEFNDSWSCQCPSGFLGVHCEKSVCENNPCEYGATCVPFPASGFICLCPIGKHGLFCENDLEIGHPVYSSSVGGLSSYSAYSLPVEIHQNMVLSFKFIPHDMEQISLMMFIGQDGYHGPTSDHLAISFIKGYIVLTWNLGSGPRRIFTTQPVPDTGHLSHIVRIGRNGQKAWLAVDNQGNVTGKSPGKLTQLNTRSTLYLGGHDSANFSLLPHDLPLHTGFSGCLFDVELNTQMTIKLQKTRAASGRGVGQCGTSLCHEHACENGGGCIHHGATYTCLCADGWFGPTCSMKYNPCDSSRHNCTEGSTCVPLRQGYYCDCPLGRTGQYCEIYEELSDVKLKGIRSYIALIADGLHQHQSCIDLEVRPLSNQGLLLYSGKKDNSGFWSLSLQGGVLELRVSPGKHRRRGDVLVIRSRRLLVTDKWHRIRAGRYGRRLFLWVEGTVNTGVLLPGETLPPRGTLIFLGGVPDLSTLPPGIVAGNLVPFHGCVRKFVSQWRWIPLNMTNIIQGRNVEDCDGTLCGGDVCDHGGSCYLDPQTLKPSCTCPKEYVGEKCETQVSCREISCQNGGRCIEEKGLPPKCHCPIGFGGGFCESAVSVEAPHFGGDSYILIDRAASGSKRRDTRSRVDVNFMYMNFTTAESNGMILWSARENNAEFVGIGVEDGILKIVWAWEGFPATTVMVPGGSVSDGAWHDLAISLDTPNITIWTDHQTIYTTNVNHPDRPLATDGLFYLGGFPEHRPVKQITHGHFTSGFSGCLQKLAWSIDSVIINFSNFEGENIKTCDPFEP